MRLASQKVADEFSQLDRIAGASWALVCHSGIMPRPTARLKAALRARDLKLYHYPEAGPGASTPMARIWAGMSQVWTAAIDMGGALARLAARL